MATLARDWNRLWRQVSALLLPVMLLGACTVTMVPAYDEQIDTGLTTLYGDTVVFIDNMIAAEGKPEGELANNVEFYNNAFGRIEALIARAQAHRVLKSCPTTKFMAQVMAKAEIGPEVRAMIGTIPQDECQVVLLRLIKDNFVDLRELHRLRGARGLPPETRGQFIDAGLGGSLRAAITVEIAKRAK